MLTMTSSEFVALCRSQVNLLIHGLGATFSVIYLMQQIAEDTESRLVPVVIYPETIAEQAQDPLQLLAKLSPDAPLRLLPSSSSLESDSSFKEAAPSAETPSSQATPSTQLAPLTPVLAQGQMVLPLAQGEMMLGLLVVGRDDRGWSAGEQDQIEQIANTLTIAWGLEQRYQWLERDRQQERQIQGQQHDRLDNLLHQFRNSLTALQTFGKLILRRLQPDDRNQDAAASIVRETTRLRELAQQLEAAVERGLAPPLALPPASDNSPPIPQPQAPLLLSGALAEDLLTLKPCSVPTVLEPLIASAQTIAQERSLSLHLQVPERLPPVWANPPVLREVLNNLLENALKYTSPGGQILVQVDAPIFPASNPWLELSVNDTGVGIPAQDLPHIFERRFRGVQADTDVPGTGLGLTIAKSLMEQMHGQIEVQSPAKVWGKAIGTSVMIRLAIVTGKMHKTEHLTS